MRKYRLHPIKIVSYSAKNLWILIFPLVRGLWEIKFDLYEAYKLLEGAWLNIFVVAVIVAAGYVKWRFSYVMIDENKIEYCSGVIFRIKTEIDFDKISAVAVEEGIFHRLIKAMLISVNTNSGLITKSDIKVLLKRKDFKDFKDKLAQRDASNLLKISYETDWHAMVLFSLIFSSSLSGAIYIAAFFIQSGRILEDILDRSLTDAINEFTSEAAEFFAIKMPPLIFGLAMLILLGRIASFVRNMLKFTNFSIKMDRINTRIKTGILKKYSYFLMNSKVNYLIIKQNLLMKIFGMMSLQVNCSGYETGKNELPVFMPLMAKSRIKSMLMLLMGEMQIQKPRIKTRKWSVIRFCLPNIILCIVLYRLAQELSLHFVMIEELIGFFLIMFEIPLIWVTVVKFVSAFLTGISMDENNICFYSCKGYKFNTVFADKSKIVLISIRKSPFQNISGTCDISMYFQSETPIKHSVKGLKEDELTELLGA